MFQRADNKMQYNCLIHLPISFQSIHILKSRTPDQVKTNKKKEKGKVNNPITAIFAFPKTEGCANNICTPQGVQIRDCKKTIQNPLFFICTPGSANKVSLCFFFFFFFWFFCC